MSLPTLRGVPPFPSKASGFSNSSTNLERLPRIVALVTETVIRYLLLAGYLVEHSELQCMYTRTSVGRVEGSCREEEEERNPLIPQMVDYLFISFVIRAQYPILHPAEETPLSLTQLTLNTPSSTVVTNAILVDER